MATKTHRTENDACAQIALAKVGAHVGATDTYLVTLRARLYYWIAEIDAELAKRAHDRAERLEALEECGDECAHVSETAPYGEGSFCKLCGETLA